MRSRALCACLGALGTLIFGAVRADPAPAAAPSALSLDEIVRRTIAGMERHPDRLICRVASHKQVLDGKGRVDEDERAEIEETRSGDEIEWVPLRKWKNGRDVTGEMLAARRRDEEERLKKGEPPSSNRKKADGDLMQPFSSRWASHYTFELLGQETLWGRPTYLLRVTAHERNPKAGNGKVWVDAEQFVALKGEFVPARLPDKADWAKFQLQYQLHASGVVVPSLLTFEGGGHFWFIKKGFRQTFRWEGCR
jgi:hypothetical protein